MAHQNWTVLLYFTGDTPTLEPSIKADVEEALRARVHHINVAMQADLPGPDGARRYIMRPGETTLVEELGQLDSGSPETFRDFLRWSLKELPAERYGLVVGGTGMFDPNSVVGHPDHNWTDVFAICDDATARNAMDIADFRGVLEAVLEEACLDRMQIVGFDMCRMQFLEVVCELDTVAAVVVSPETEVPASGWDYERLLRSWDEAAVRVDDGCVDEVARRLVQGAADAYCRTSESDLVLSAIDVRRLDDLTRDFDGFTVAYLQALGDSIAWEAREAVAASALGDGDAYDLRQLLLSVRHELNERVKEPINEWLARLLSGADAARRADYVLALERACVALRPQALRDRLQGGDGKVLDACIAAVRAIRRFANDLPSARRLPAVVLPSGRLPGGRDVWELCFANTGALPPRLREEYAVLQQERERAKYLAKLADRALRHFGDDETGRGVVLERFARMRPNVPPLCGLAVYRPKQLDRLIDSNYLRLEFTRRVHWAALLGAIDLIQRDHRALWRIISSTLGSSDARGREDLIQRLVGRGAVASRYRGQFRALTPSPLITLSLEPLPGGSATERAALSDRYRLRLESIRRDATLKQNETRVNPSTIERSLVGLEQLLKQGWVDSEDLEQIESFGRTLGEDIMQDLEPSLAGEIALAGERELHMLLQIPQQLMKYPWELMHDGRAWLSERFALGRQVFMEQSGVRWAARRRSGGLRVLIIGDPVLQDAKGFQQLPGARDEAEHVAALFERLQDQVGVALEFDRRRDARIHQVVTRDECRRLLRSGVYDIIHFAGHAYFDRDEPLRSGWVLSDGTLWAQEIRNTLMRCAPPWLVYANACEAAMDEPRPVPKYQGDVHGLASAFINKGVGAYIAPLWPVDDGMAMKLAADFYTLLALDRMTVGEALRHAKRRAKDAVLGSDVPGESLVSVPAYMGLSWASLVLYGDPTQTIVQQLAARSEGELTVPAAAKPAEPPRPVRRRRAALHAEAPLQAAPSTVLQAVSGPGMRTVDRVRGPGAIASDEAELAVVEKGGIRYWASIDSGGVTPLRPDGLPAIAESAQRKWQQERGFADYLRIVGRWVTGRLDYGLVGEIARAYDEEVVSTERLLIRDPFSDELRPCCPADETPSTLNPQARGCLLLIHGTFSKSAAPVGGLGRGFFDWAHRHYRQVLAFDHWTLSRSPLENADMLWRLLPAWIKAERGGLDIITHSRGGLVARALVQLPIGNGTPANPAAAVGNVVFVGTPNFGTSLADPNNWARAADLLVNLVHLDAIGLYGKLSGFLARLAISRLGAEVLDRLPGLQAQNPGARAAGDFLGRLVNAPPPQNVRFSAVSTNYEPRRDETHLKFIAKVAGDAAVDQFFNGFNDLVVNTRNVWLDTVLDSRLVQPENLLLITPPDSGLEADEGARVAGLYGVHHTNLFEIEQTREFLVSQLRRPIAT